MAEREGRLRRLRRGGAASPGVSTLVRDTDRSAAEAAIDRLLQRRQFERLCRAGLTPVEASRLAARLAGLPALGRGSWSYREVQQLVFVSWLVAKGRLGS